MKKIEITYEKLDFNRLVGATFKFAEKHFKKYFAIPWTFEIGDSPVYGKDDDSLDSYEDIPENTDRDFRNELVNEGKLLFFTFSTNNTDDLIACADGKAYEMNEDNIFNDEFYIGDTECLGYLLKYNAGILTIQAATNFSGACMCPASINIPENCGVFDEPMYEFIKTFINDDI
ncbi:MAG TPA: hypothetical protein VIM70_05305 [Clostridium sp.]|uniref:hypothetical protein n=1 Tax=Clostridium sp. TaxID=1506 RepID=UPI002F923833